MKRRRAHLFITTTHGQADVEIRILYETFMVSVFQGVVEIDTYIKYNHEAVLACHRNCETWEEQPCSW